MFETITFNSVLLLLLGVFAGAAIVWFFMSRIVWRLREAYSEKLTRLEAELSGAQSTLNAERSASNEKFALLIDAKEQLKLEFSQIASRLFDEKGRRFEQESRTRLEDVLKPFREQVQKFEKTVIENYANEGKERFSLIKEIAQLKNLNERLSNDARELTGALRGDNKAQGIWGEMILEKVLEESGLKNGREYETQKRFRDEEGTKRPDAIVHLPNKKDVVIDAKVSLTAYERYQRAETKEQKDEALKQHLLSLQGHINSLSRKSYESLEGIATLDFVIIFVAIEGAYLLALDANPKLYQQAFDKGVLVAGPSTLLLTLRIIQNIWRAEDQNRNALQIAQKAGFMLDKFSIFHEYLEKIGADLDRAKGSFEQARKSLSTGNGNLIRRAQELKELGVRNKKELPNLSDETEAV
jgi:DNA recombination protein RmuC